MCHSVAHRKYKHCRPKCRILWPFMLAVLTGKILQKNSKGHWKVKIISIAAEGT